MKRMVYPKKRQLLWKELLSCRPNPEAKRLLEMYMPKRKTGTDTVVCNGKLWLIKNTVEDSYTGVRKPVTTMERISRDNKPWWVPLRCVGLAYTTNGTIKFDTRCFQVFDVTKVIPFTIGAVQYDYTINGEARVVIVDGNRCLIHESQLSKYELDDFGRLGVVKACDICGLRYTSASCPNIELHDATRAGYHSIVRLNKAGDARFTIGFEVEKEDEDSPKFLEAYKAGWIAERDGSLSDYIGTEYVSHVLDMMSPDTDRYKTIDNYDCLMAALDAIKRSGVAVKFEDCAITDHNMYVRVVCPAIVAESEILLRKYLPNGYNSTGIMAGLVISNSEVGSGAFTISPRLVVLACRNGLVVKKDAMRKVHIGAQLDIGSAVKWSDRTQRTNAELITSQTTDAVTQFLSQEYLGKTIATIELANQPLKRPTPVAQAVIPTIGVPLEHQEDVLRYFFESGDLSAFGLSQAATFYAKECGDSELQMKLEESALEIMEAAINHDRL